MKSSIKYWNPLKDKDLIEWEEIEDSEGNLRQLTLAMDEENGDYTQLTKFNAGYNTEKFGAKSHDYPEEIFVISGRLYDYAFEQWLETGHYASRPLGEIHRPFMAETDVIILEMSYPSQSKEK